jgi:hypothetical protein
LLIWQGLGAFAFVIPFFVWLAVIFLVEAVIGHDQATRFGQELGGIALLISAGLVGLLARRLDAKPGRRMIDAETGEEIILRDRHTMFFVPMRIWAYVYVVIGVILVVVGLLQ